jgi:hypothetical protein
VVDPRRSDRDERNAKQRTNARVSGHEQENELRHRR